MALAGAGAEGAALGLVLLVLAVLAALAGVGLVGAGGMLLLSVETGAPVGTLCPSGGAE